MYYSPFVLIAKAEFYSKSTRTETLYEHVSDYCLKSYYEKRALHDIPFVSLGFYNIPADSIEITFAQHN